MKKLILFASIFVVGAIAVLIKVQASTNIAISDIVLANIEALASGESSGGTTLKCYKTVSINGSGQLTHVTYCGDCKATKANAWSSEWTCKE